MAVDDELEQAHSLRLDGPVSASYSMGTSGRAKGRPWQNPFAERLIGSIRRDRRLERGRDVEPAKLVPERDDGSDDGDQRGPGVGGRRGVGGGPERASHRFLSLPWA